MDETVTPADLPILSGRRVRLRQPLPADVAARVAIPRDPEEDRMYGGPGTAKTFAADEVKSGFARYAARDLATTRRFQIAALAWPDGRPVDEPDGRYIGHVRLHGIDWKELNAHLAIGIFDRRFWSHGYGSEAIDLILGYAFETLRLHRVDLRVLEFNMRAIRAYEKCGFVHEGVERESCHLDRRWYSDVIMGILEDEYRARRVRGEGPSSSK